MIFKKKGLSFSFEHFWNRSKRPPAACHMSSKGSFNKLTESASQPARMGVWAKMTRHSAKSEQLGLWSVSSLWGSVVEICSWSSQGSLVYFVFLGRNSSGRFLQALITFRSAVANSELCAYENVDRVVWEWHFAVGVPHDWGHLVFPQTLELGVIEELSTFPTTQTKKGLAGIPWNIPWRPHCFW